jgi:DtxR family Mn-dependent transcriptional regulator
VAHSTARVRWEHYLEAIYQLEPAATLTKIAETLGVKPSTARKMIVQLQSQGLVEYMGREGVRLTEKGRKKIEELNYIHKTLAEFFKTIGVDEQLAETEAEKLEHLIDKRVVEKIRQATHLIQAITTICQNNKKPPHNT